MASPEDPIRELELLRWKRREAKDLEVERNRGPRPLEGLAGGETTWTQATNEAAAEEVHGDDRRKSEEATERQAERRESDAD